MITKPKEKIRPRSKKRAAQERNYTAIRKLFLDANPFCQTHDYYFPEEHGDPLSSEIHHKKGRIGELLTAVEFFLPVCRRCHQRIEENPAEAKEQGFSLSRLAKD